MPTHLTAAEYHLPPELHIVNLISIGRQLPRPRLAASMDLGEMEIQQISSTLLRCLMPSHDIHRKDLPADGAETLPANHKPDLTWLCTLPVAEGLLLAKTCFLLPLHLNLDI